MTNNHIKSYLLSANLPFKIKEVNDFKGYYLIKDENGNEYVLQVLSKEEYNVYLDLINASKKIKKAIYQIENEFGIFLFFDYESMSENKAREIKIENILKDLFKITSFDITLKKEHLVNLNNIYKVLDNKFSYLEMRIREIETNPIKNDISWVILSKYNVVLDAKIYLYDLQSDIFKLIDSAIVVKYGLIYKDIYYELYSRDSLLPDFNIYYGPIGMLLSRLYLSLDNLKLEVKDLDKFNKKYFCFMCLYILILNLNLEMNLNIFSISNYILITNKIKSFILSYKAIIEE